MEIKERQVEESFVSIKSFPGNKYDRFKGLSLKVTTNRGRETELTTDGTYTIGRIIDEIVRGLK